MARRLRTNAQEATRRSCSYTELRLITLDESRSIPPSRTTSQCTRWTAAGGESGDADEYALEREFEDVAAVVESIDQLVILLGHSYGALCPLEAALQTDNLRALILYEPPIPCEIVGPHLYLEDVHAEMEALLADGEDEQALIVFFRDIVKQRDEGGHRDHSTNGHAKRWRDVCTVIPATLADIRVGYHDRTPVAFVNVVQGVRVNEHNVLSRVFREKGCR